MRSVALRISPNRAATEHLLALFVGKCAAAYSDLAARSLLRGFVRCGARDERKDASTDSGQGYNCVPRPAWQVL